VLIQITGLLILITLRPKSRTFQITAAGFYMLDTLSVNHDDQTMVTEQ